jgi:hypothetical protein
MLEAHNVQLGDDTAVRQKPISLLEVGNIEGPDQPERQDQSGLDRGLFPVQDHLMVKLFELGE